MHECVCVSMHECVPASSVCVCCVLACTHTPQGSEPTGGCAPQGGFASWMAPAVGRGPSRSQAGDLPGVCVSVRAQPADEPPSFPRRCSQTQGQTMVLPPLSPRRVSKHPLVCPQTSLTPACCPHRLSPGPRGRCLRWGSPTPSHSPCRRSPRLNPRCPSMASQSGLNSLS